MDARLFRTVNRVADHTAWAHGVARTYAKDGIVLFGLLLVAAWLLARRDGDVRAVAGVLATGVATLVAVGLAQPIGHAVGRARPYTAMPATHLLVAKSADFSFPSDHATAVGAVAVGLLLVRPRLGAIAAALALLLAFTRVYVGVHYPGDVLAGLVLGGAVAVAVRLLALRVGVPALERLGRTRLRRLIVAHD